MIHARLLKNLLIKLLHYTSESIDFVVEERMDRLIFDGDRLSYEEQLVKKDRNNRKVLDKLKWKLMNTKDVPADKREQLAWIKARYEVVIVVIWNE